MENMVKKLNVPQFKKFKNKNVFITGHTGFIGSWLTFWLYSLGANITGYSKNIPTNPSLFEKLEIKNQINHNLGDINDFNNLKKHIKKSEANYIFHLAAQPIVLKSYENPLETIQTNVIGTANLLESLRDKSDCKSVIVFTSDKCYKNFGKKHFFKEEDPLGGDEPYGTSKAAAEIITSSYIESFFKKSKVGIATIRAGNVIGGGDWSENRIFPDSIRMLKSKKPIIVRNPNSIRPFQFVLEPISAMLYLTIILERKHNYFSKSWNVGPNSKKSIDVENLVNEIIKYWGSGDYMIKKDNESKEAKILLLNSDKINHEIGWHSTYSTVDAIKETVDWYKYDLSNKDIKYFMAKQIRDYCLEAKNQKIRWAL